MIRYLILLIFITGCASAVNRRPAVEDSPELHDPKIALSEHDIDRIVQGILPVAKKHVATLESPLITYHYNAANAKSPVTTMTEAKRQMIETPGTFESSLMPNGFYLAADPKASIDYGGQDPMLVLIEIHAGAKILVDYADTSPEEVEAFRTAIAPLRLQPGAQARGLLHLSFLIPTDPATQYKIAAKLFMELGISGVAYDWYASNIQGCRNHESAFAMNDRKAFSVVAFYSDTWSHEKKPMAALVKRLFDEAVYDSKKTFHLPQELVRLSAEQPVKDADYVAWRSHSVFGCGRLSNLEKAANP